MRQSDINYIIDSLSRKKKSDFITPSILVGSICFLLSRIIFENSNGIIAFISGFLFTISILNIILLIQDYNDKYSDILIFEMLQTFKSQPNLNRLPPERIFLIFKKGVPLDLLFKDLDEEHKLEIIKSEFKRIFGITLKYSKKNKKIYMEGMPEHKEKRKIT